MPSHVKTYDGSEDPEDHHKIFWAAAKVERWAMPTWCHMFNSTLTGSARVWFDDLPLESVDSYDDLKEAFLTNFRLRRRRGLARQKSALDREDRIPSYHFLRMIGVGNPLRGLIRWTCLVPSGSNMSRKRHASRERESTEDFVRRFKVESKDVKGAPEIMRISGFMHGITNPELIKRLHDKIPKTVDEMMRITMSFLKGEVAAGNQELKKSLPP
ncbi:reverse transcriptase domain-containing protein [Tanacetum coccineum]